MTAASDFSSTLRHGARGGSPTVVVYVRYTGDAHSIAGFAVSKAVGGAVTRNRVKRRLRSIMAQEWDGLGNGAAVVVRALPAAATASYSALTRDLQRAIAVAGARAVRS